MRVGLRFLLSLLIILPVAACARPTPAAPASPIPAGPTMAPASSPTSRPSPVPSLTLPATATRTPTAIPTVSPSPPPTPTFTATATRTPAPTRTPRPTATPTPEISSDALRGIPGAECLPPGRPVEIARPVRVIDGDTLDVAIGGQTRRVRYIGIDAPERDQAFYAEATAAHRNLVEGKTLYLVRDVSETDRYGRLLRYGIAGDVFVNLTLVREGYAQTLTVPPDVSCAEAFRSAEAEARSAGRGLWGMPAPTPMATTLAGEVVFLAVRGGPPGGTAYVAVRTAPGALCEIVYITPAGNRSRAAGLVPKAADASGQVEWTWKIGTGTRPGTGRVTVTCNGASASAPIEIR
ncbi:thermonuclease family protein [Thermoflexus sp.]|uniref:thermonuclease family protein n=1 Tax=Thermoflexus sp. TaxID=1969742 RepID=UPI002ADE5572|nr:thermonuclease family protein [Thermoflexus sp.]